MNNFRVVIGIILLIAAIGMFFYVEEIKDERKGLLGTVTLEQVVTQMCNAGWGDVFNLTGQCLKVQALYYSPWILGFFGVVFLATAGPYRGYHGYGGAGSHNRRFRMRRKTKRRLIVLISISVVVGIGIYGYANYEITIANQNIDDIIPPENLEKAYQFMSENMPVKLKERP